MIPILTTTQMRAVEAAADASGLTYAQMMQNAGAAAARRALDVLTQRSITPPARITVIVGPGNNGGDGLVAGLRLAEAGCEVRFYLLRPRGADDPNFAAVREANLFVAIADDDQRYRVLTHLILSADLVIDALLGIGVSLPLRPEVSKLLRAVQQALSSEDEAQEAYRVPLQARAKAVSPYLFAIDCPSGLDCDTGQIDPAALHADETITFIACKPGLLTFPGAAYVGQITVSEIGVPPALVQSQRASRALVSADAVHALLPPRPADANKGTFGRVLIIGGSAQYTGAVGLAAIAAYRSGAGLVTAAVPSVVRRALQGVALETTWLDFPAETHLTADAVDTLHVDVLRSSAVLIGPGMGTHEETAAFLDRLLTLLASAENTPPFIFDADALNILSKWEHWWERLPPQTILTPHPGEMARLLGQTAAEVQADRWQAASAARDWKATLVLKGAHTLVSDAAGSISTMPFKNSALATAGTGDVLAGLIAGFAAQRLSPENAAVTGAFVHGLAGELAVKTVRSGRAVIASDVLNAISAALKALEDG